MTGGSAARFAAAAVGMAARARRLHPLVRPRPTHQRVLLGLVERLDVQVDVQVRPVEVIGSHALHVQHVTDLCLLEPGNISYARKTSRSPSHSHRPWAEMFVTSTSEVLFPRSADFIFVLPNETQGGRNLPSAQPAALG